MTTAIVQTFPAYREMVRKLVAEHLEIEDQPLLLALYYAPDRDKEDVFLLEVTENFAEGRVDENKELFEVAFSATAGVDIPAGRWLRLTLTSPNELRTALMEKWQLAKEIRDAVQMGHSEMMFCVPGIGDELMLAIRA